jgi:hypothetical protein
MKRLTLDEIADPQAYESLRTELRARIIALKRNRRLGIGDDVSVVFENRETVRWQVQEMLRVERIREPAKIQHELDVYNELIPDESELSATLMIEITDLARIKPELDRLVGIDETVFLVLGAGADEERIAARFDAKQRDEERISAVQYIKFPLSARAAGRLREPSVRARLCIEHPHYAHQADLPPALRESLLADLAGDPQPLLRPAPAGAVREPSDGLLLETARVRARRAPQPAGPGHVVVEPRQEVASLLEAEPALLTELIEVVKRYAREILDERGSCRVLTDLHAGRLRWHVFAPGR